jgi:hypothetical protein
MNKLCLFLTNISPITENIIYDFWNPVTANAITDYQADSLIVIDNNKKVIIWDNRTGNNHI